MGLAVLVLIAASLMVKSFLRLEDVPFGFDRSHALSLYISMPKHRYPDEDSQRTYVRKLRGELSQIPGVEAVGGIDFLPLSGFWNATPFLVEGTAPKPAEQPESDLRLITPRYFDSMHISLVRGREISETDTKTMPLVAVVNQTFARRFLPNTEPIGSRLNLGSLEKPEWAVVVGVIADVKHFGLDQETHPELYLPFDQAPNTVVAFVLRTNGDPATFATAAREAVWRVDRDQPVTRVISMEEAAEESLAIRKITMSLLTGFALACLLLACVATYGIVSQAVQYRTREIGLRMALGSTPNGVLRMVLRDTVWLAAAGAALGAFAAMNTMRFVSSMLFGISATDLATFVYSIIIIVVVAILASAIPAWRAMNIDPMRALRYE
jgi:putative ABC transport system permease protein